jgi:tetratricopeptide (TPR) repeat protein
VPDAVLAVLAAGISHAERALRIDSTSSRAREALGILWFEAGNHARHPDSVSQAYARAERLLRQVSEADTTLADALSTLGSLHFDRGEFEQAYVAAERAWRADAWLRDPQETLGRLFIYAFEAEEDADAERWCTQYGARIPDDWFGGFCRLMLMTWGTGPAPPADSALSIALRAEGQAPRVIRSVVGAQLRTQAAGALARAGKRDDAKRVLEEVRTTVAANPLAAREPFGTELLEIEAGVRLRLGERDTAAALLRELLRRQPDRGARLTASRRFRELAIAVPTRTAR